VEKTLDFITIGASVLDTFVMLKSAHRHIDRSKPNLVEECFPLGTKMDALQIVQQSGGGATNSAVTFARQKLNGIVLSKVGDDFTGSTIIDELRSENVIIKYLSREKGGHTGQSVILVDPDGVRTILTDRGSSGHILEKDLDVLDGLKSRWIYLTSMNGAEATISKIFYWADKAGAKVAWNPGVADLKLSAKVLRSWLKRCGLILLNKEEAGQLLEHQGTVAEMTEELVHQGAYRGVVTDGVNTLSGFDNGRLINLKPSIVKTVDQTGAGDAFGSGLVAGLLKGYSYHDSVELGLLNSAHVVMKIGAKSGIIYS